MTFEELQKIQSEMPTDVLIEKCRQWISNLCKSGGRAWSLRVPPDPDHDPDLLFSELCRRVKESVDNPVLVPISTEIDNYAIDIKTTPIAKLSFPSSDFGLYTIHIKTDAKYDIMGREFTFCKGDIVELKGSEIYINKELWTPTQVEYVKI